MSPNGTRTIHVYTNAPSARILVNGAPFGAPVAIAAFGAAAVFFDVPYAPGTLVAEGLALDGATVLASDTAASWGPPTALVLSLDAPLPRTGTGAALLLDGADAALVRHCRICGRLEQAVRAPRTAAPRAERGGRPGLSHERRAGVLGQRSFLHAGAANNGGVAVNKIRLPSLVFVAY